MIKKEIAKLIFENQSNYTKLIGFMLSGNVHDMNTPLSVIQGQVSILNSKLQKGIDIDEETLRKMLERFTRCVESISNNLSSIRQFYKLDSSEETSWYFSNIFETIELLNKNYSYKQKVSINCHNNVSKEVIVNTHPQELVPAFTQLIQLAIAKAQPAPEKEEKIIDVIIDQDQTTQKINGSVDFYSDQEISLEDIQILISKYLFEKNKGHFEISQSGQCYQFTFSFGLN